MNQLLDRLNENLKKRESEHLLRKLYLDHKGIDFITNDYLGFAKLINVESDPENYSASASRLLGGNNQVIEGLEAEIAAYHGFEAALFYPSGYTANLGLFSCLLSRHDTYIYDELIHASIRDGIRLSLAHSFSFKHNNLIDLEQKIKHAKGNIVVVVEALYSMDGDKGNLKEIAELCEKYKVGLIVDEAHSVGVFGKEGRGLVHELKLQSKVLAVVYTYGKAMGCHGGAIATQATVKNYLINFSRPFIYTTAPSGHQVMSVKTAYRLLQSPIHEKNKLSLRKNVMLFAETMEKQLPDFETSESHINKFMVGGVEKTIAVANQLREAGYICRPVLSPTVEPGTERIRINLHAYNSVEQILNLIQTFKKIIHG